MWRAIWLFIVFAGLVFVVSWISDQSGDVTLYWLDRRIDMSISVLLGTMVVIAVLAALLYRILLAVRRAPRSFKKYLAESRRKKGYVALTRGMVAVAAGDAEEARRQVKRADGLLGDPALTLLLSAQTAQLSGDTQAAQKFFTAMLERPETEFLGIRGQLTQAMKSGDKGEALRLAHHANTLKPKSEWVASNLFDLQVRERRWGDALNTLSASVKNRLVKEGEARAHRAALEHLLGLDAAGNAQQALRHAKKSHDQDPGFSPGSGRYAALLLDAGQHRKAASVLEKSWSQTPHPDLLEPYLTAREAIDANARLLAGQRLAKVNPHHSDSHLAVALLALKAQIWGEARKNLEAILTDTPSAGVCRMMADLADKAENDTEKSREWLVRATKADPDPAWVCATCGHVHAEWLEICGKCENFCSLRWETPPHASAPGLAHHGQSGELPNEPMAALPKPSNEIG
ncbi:MAG: heme biosynthesis protein HemY [Rhodospirillales bacterium]|nr:heme biosynthesis protein HemY [Rhodospirillaceae bacterium]MBT5036741.1 heme biosynthesis protein HemY [Rhodospirillaceae bacterium]MBT6219661.1 heme biosynthesis protein HemY [Rhodospirillaceae bacterium]MBT6360973.1 heme biosynthesis protein HemY [Rhodospirillaceae bacterium]MBT8001593.1 heme biosynthesis protein HemY [Rhodospirillales bacterium]